MANYNAHSKQENDVALQRSEYTENAMILNPSVCLVQYLQDVAVSCKHKSAV